jgi:hypothetical protein
VLQEISKNWEQACMPNRHSIWLQVHKIDQPPPIQETQQAASLNHQQPYIQAKSKTQHTRNAVNHDNSSKEAMMVPIATADAISVRFSSAAIKI